jgi:hypothetical protein
MSSERTSWVVAAGLAVLCACAPSDAARKLTVRIDGVEPACGDSSTQTPIVVRGSLPVMPTVSVSDPGEDELDTAYRAWIGDIALLSVVWRDAGTLTATVPASTPVGDYSLTLESPWGDRATAASVFEVRQGGCAGTPGALAVAASVAPNAVTVGQQVTVTAQVQNTGQRALLDVEAAVSTTPSGVVLTGSTGSPRDLAGGQSATFTWTYTTAETTPEGGATFGISAAGLDDDGAPVAAPSATTNLLYVNPPANVTATMQAPGTANVGQRFTVRVTATNTGGAPALVAAVMATSAPGVTWLSPVRQEIRIPRETARTFDWTFTVDATRDASFSVEVTATDENTGQPLTVAPTPPVVVRLQRPAALVTTVAVAPTVVAPSQAVTVVATVRNTGQAVASAVSASMVAIPERFTLLTSPQTQNTTIGEGAFAAFTWTYRAESGASVGTFSVDAAGIDANSGDDVVAARASSSQVAVTYTVGGTVVGLTRAGLVLRNGTEDLPIASDATTFTFAVPVASGQTYAVTVVAQPVGQTCTPTQHATGSIGSSAVVDVVVACATEQHALTTDVSPAGAGTLSCGGAPCQASYPFSTAPMEITYAASPGYAFDSWSGDCTGNGSCVVTMDRDRSVIAVFSSVAAP